MKTGLIVEGGGMKCAYSAGVLDGFLDEGISFDYCIGVSAGAANAVSFLAGQRERNLRFYTVHSASPKYFGLRSFVHTGNLFGLDYIYGELSEAGGSDPVDYNAFMENDCEFECVATDAEDGSPRYFSKEDMRADDLTVIKATCALPVASRPVDIEGHLYYDGGVADSIPIERAKEKGCDKVVVILSKPRGYRMTPEAHKPLYRRVLKKYPSVVQTLNHRHEIYNSQMEEILRWETVGKARIFYTPNLESMGTYSTDPKIATMLYKSGIYDAEKRVSEIKEFLKKDE